MKCIDAFCLPADGVQQILYDVENLHRSEGLEKTASDKGFIISDNQGSGNCMFHALAEQLTLTML